MHAFAVDLRDAIRTLRRAPVVSVAVILILGAGIGANTTVFAWLDNIVSHPFPAIPDGGELVALNVSDGDGRVDGMPPIAWPTLEDWRARVTGFSGIAAHAQARLNLRQTATGVGEPVWVEMVSSTFFSTLGVRPAAGRFFEREDEDGRAPVAVLSHAAWQRRFGAAPDTIGRQVLWNGVPLTVIGIASPRFGGVVTGLSFDAWVPLWMQPTLVPGSDWARDRSVRRLQAIARLRPGTTIEAARAELHRIARDVSRSNGEAPVSGAGVRWISETQLGSLMAPLGSAMLAVTVVVLAASCANVAGLLLAREAAHRRDTAVRLALGAARVGLIRQALVHAGVLSLLGGAAGILMAYTTRDGLRAFIPRVSLPVALAIDLNWRVLTFAIGLAWSATLLSAIVPALRGSRPAVIDALKAASGGGSGRRSRLRQSLVVAQVALSLAALIVAGLFLRGVATASRLPLGFAAPDRVLLVSTDVAFTRLTGAPLVSLVEQALARLRAVPGAAAVAAASFVPLSFGGLPGVRTTIDGYVPRADESMLVGRGAVTEGYFETMGMPLVEGRSFTVMDRADGERVAVVNQAFVARYWHGQPAVGRRLNQGDGWSRIVGVVRDAAIDSATGPPAPLVFRPWTQVPVPAITVHVRATTSPLGLITDVGRTLAAVHPDLPALDPGTLADHIRAATFVPLVGAAAFSVFGALGLAIAVIGLYAVVAQLAVERRRDHAIAMALGAQRSTIAASVIGPAVRIVTIGLLLGTVLAFGIGTFVRARVPAIDGIDPWSLFASIALLIVTTLGACGWPAWRAAHGDIVAAVRAD